MALTRKRRAWMEEYLRCWNATEAARRVGYKHPNTQGPRLLLDVGIQAEIEQRIEELTMQADEVLLRLAEQARGLPKEYFHPDGSLNAAAIVTADKTHLIKKTKQTRDGLEVELYDGQRALVDIGRALGLFKDKLDVTTGGEPIAIPQYFEIALMRAYSDDSTGEIPRDGGESELPV